MGALTASGLAAAAVLAACAGEGSAPCDRAVTRRYATVACHGDAGAARSTDAGPAEAGSSPELETDAGVAMWEPLTALPPGYTCDSSGITEAADGCTYDRHQSGRVVQTCTHTSAPFCR